MNLRDFDYQLPEHLIAQHPLHRREQARLMVVDRRRKTVTHDVFANVRRYLPPRSCLILNDSKVVAARLLGKRERSGGKVEVFLLKRLDDGCTYQTLLRPLRRLKNGDRLLFAGGRVVAEVVDWEKRIVRFKSRNITAELERIGHIPLPPYIKRSDRAEDRKYYQTVYAQKAGSVAAPTAGLHFTNRLLAAIERDGHTIEKVTLHINYATFKPVEEPDITKHKMHVEDYAVTKTAYKTMQQAKKEGRKIIAVGTTSCRVLETLAATRCLKGSTGIFIYPGYGFRMTDALITNFHLPLSTLLMLVYAFGTRDLVAKAYEEAVKKKYRFFSYGDAMMII